MANYLGTNSFFLKKKKIVSVVRLKRIRKTIVELI
jgi:hypothetical protein